MCSLSLSVGRTVLCLGCFAMAASEGFSILTLNYEMPLPDATIGGGKVCHNYSKFAHTTYIHTQIYMGFSILTLNYEMPLHDATIGGGKVRLGQSPEPL
jgi:hypothetical protein